MSAAQMITVAQGEGDQRLDRWIRRHFPHLTQGAIEKMCRKGEVRVDGGRVTSATRVQDGQAVRIPPLATSSMQPAPAVVRTSILPADEAMIQAAVLWKDEHIIALNKPPGLPSQGGSGQGGRHVDGLTVALTFGFKDRPKLVHRLDKDTSGVLLLARTARAAAFFSKAFSGRTARKVYWALTVGMPEPEAGEIDAPLAKQPGTGGEKMHVDTEVGLNAKTRYRVLDHAALQAAWVEFQPLTGRTHQIRVHAAALGHPIVGDAKYGGKEAFLTGGVSRKLHLHARRLLIDHPDGGSLDIIADLPNHMSESFNLIGFDLANGELPLDEVHYLDTPEGKRKAENADAKARRKSRKGERRGRGGEDARAPREPRGSVEPRGRGKR